MPSLITIENLERKPEKITENLTCHLPPGSERHLQNILPKDREFCSFQAPLTQFWDTPLPGT